MTKQKKPVHRVQERSSEKNDKGNDGIGDG
ncbi:hypothetical protein IMSAGC011_01782 [Lachnospiraceae bacterium]|nr:hypothetical protein IMSAGC011_01782 [Lachnospiraceae bacterium]